MQKRLNKLFIKGNIFVELINIQVLNEIENRYFEEIF